MENNKSWMAILLCVSMTVGNMAPAFSNATIVGDEIAKIGEQKEDTLEDIQNDIKDVLENGLNPSDELYFSMEMKEEITIVKSKNEVPQENDETPIEDNIEEIQEQEGEEQEEQIEEVQEPVADEEEEVEEEAYEEEPEEDPEEEAPAEEMPKEDVPDGDALEDEVPNEETPDEEMPDEAMPNEAEPVNENVEPESTTMPENVEPESTIMPENVELESTTAPENVEPESTEPESTEPIPTTTYVGDALHASRIDDATDSDADMIEEEIEVGDALYASRVENATDSDIDMIDEEIIDDIIASDSEIEEEIEVATGSEIEEVEVATESEIEESTPSMTRRNVATLAEVEMPIVMLGADPGVISTISVLSTGWWGDFIEVGDLAAWQNITKIEIYDSATTVPLVATTSDGLFEYEVKDSGATLEIRPLKDEFRIEGYNLFNNGYPGANERFNNVEKIGFYGENVGDEPSNVDLINVENKNYFGMFHKLSSLTTLDNLEYVLPNDITSMQLMFSNCKELTNFDFSSINTSQVTNMSYMFQECEKLENINFSNIDTSNVQDMSWMFQNCYVLNNIDISKLDFSCLTNCSWMFGNCHGLTTIYASTSDILKTKTGLNSEGMFSMCSALVGENGTTYDNDHTNVDYACIDGYDKSDNKGYFTRKYDVPTTNYKFEEGWYNTSIDGAPTKENLTGVVFKLGIPDKTDYLRSDGRGSYYAKFTIPDSNGLVCVVGKGGGFDKVAYVYAPYLDDPTYSTFNIEVNCKNLFKDFSNVKTIENISNLYGNNCTDCSHMFDGCTQLTTVDFTGFDASNVATMSYMFNECSEIDNLNINFETTTTTLRDTSYMFSECTNLDAITFGSNFDTSNVVNMEWMFAYCPFGASNAPDLSGFNTVNVENMKGMFYSAFGSSPFTEFDISNFRFDSCTTTRNMFAHPTPYNINLNIKLATEFHESSLTDTSYMFGRSGIKSVNLEGLDTSLVTEMTGMFRNTNMTKIDISNMRFDNVTRIDDMFRDSASLVTIYASTSNIIKTKHDAGVNTTDMFFGCSALVGECGTSISSNPVDGSFAVIDGMPDSSVKGYFTHMYTVPTQNYKLSADWYDDTIFTTVQKDALTKVLIKNTAPEYSEYGAGYVGRYDIPDSNGLVCILSIDGADKNAYIYAPYLDDPAYSMFTIETEAKDLFRGFTNITGIENIENLDMTDSQDFSHMYDGCEEILEIYVPTASNVTNIEYMFASCRNVINITFADGFKGQINATSLEELFKDLYDLTTLNVKWGVNHIDTSNANTMESMYDGCESLESINLEGLIASNVTTMKKMFGWCPVLSALDLSGLDTSKVTDMSYMFSGCTELDTLIFGSNFKTDKVTDMTQMFMRCPLSNGLDVSHFDTRKVEHMEHMFDEALTAYNGTEFDISNFRFDNCNYVSYMFDAAFNEEHPVKLRLATTYHANNIENMRNMFNGAKIKSVNLEGLDTSHVTTMESMFEGSTIETIDISAFNFDNIDISGDTGIKGMFNTCQSLTTIYASSSNVIKNNFSNVAIFENCSVNLKGENGTVWSSAHVNGDYGCIDGMPNSSTKGYFSLKYDEPTGDYRLKEGWYGSSHGGVAKEDLDKVVINKGLPNISDYSGNYKDKFVIEESGGLMCVVSDDNNAYIYAPYLDDASYSDYVIETECKYLFKDFSGITLVDNISYLDVSECNDFGHMFDGCTNILSIDISSFVASASNIDYMFWGCDEVTEIKFGDGFNTTNVTSMKELFYNLSALTTITIPFNTTAFDTSNVTDMGALFSGCEALKNVNGASGENKINLNGMNTANVSTMSEMFSGCEVAEYIDLSTFNTENVKLMNGMFDGCEALRELNVSNFNTAYVTTMEKMFNDCKNIGTLDASNFNTINVTDMQEMFSGCIELNTLTLGDSFKTENVTNMEAMFYYCPLRDGLDLSSFDTGNVETMKQMFFQALAAYEGNTFDISNFRYDSCQFVESMFDSAFNQDHPVDIKLATVYHASNISDMSYMFADAKVKSVNLEGLDTSHVEKMFSMFDGSYIETLDIRTMNFDNLEDAMYMFKDCTKLTTIYASASNILKVKHDAGTLTTTEMFDGSTLLTGENGTAYADANPKDGTYACIDGMPNASNKGYFTMVYDKPTDDYKLNAGWYDDSIFSVASTNQLTKVLIKNTIPKYSDYGSGYVGKYVIPDSNGLVCVLSVEGAEKKAYIYAPYLDDPDFASYTIETQGKDLFRDFSNITEIDNISYLDMTDSQDFGHMYDGCTKIENIYIPTASDVQNIEYMFKNCVNVETITFADGFGGTLNATSTMKELFYGLVKLHTLMMPFGTSNINTSFVKDMDGLFRGCKVLKNVNGDNVFDLTGMDTSNVATMSNMFYQCQKMESVNLSSFDTASAKNMEAMFAGCNIVENVTFGPDFTASSVTNMYGMFMGCNNIESLDLSYFDTTNVTRMEFMFSGCNKLTNLTIDHDDFKTSNVTNMRYMFSGVPLPVDFDFSGFDTSKVISMSGMFASAFKNDNGVELDISNFSFEKCEDLSSMFRHAFNDNNVIVKLPSYHTNEVKNMSYMFSNAHIVTVNIGDIDTSKVASMSEMFSDSKIVRLDISKMSFDNAKDMSRMFKGCANLITIYASASNPIKARKTAYSSLNYTDMFDGCNALVGENDTKYNVELHADGDYAVIDGLPDKNVKGYFTMVYVTPTDDYKLSSGWYNSTFADVASTNQLTKVLIRNTIPKRSDYGAGYVGRYVIPDSNGLICILSEDGADKNAYIYAPYLDEPIYAGYRIKTEAKDLFRGFENIKAVENIDYLYTYDSQDFSHMYDGCTKIENIYVGSASNVTNVDGMFASCDAVTTITFADGFDTTGVTSMNHLFYLLTNLRTIHMPFDKGFDTSNVVDMESMFEWCGIENVNGTNIIDLRGMDTSNVATMSNMFLGCSAQNMNLSTFNTYNAKTMKGMFASCNFQELNISSFDTSNVTDMSEMFYGCFNIETLNLDNFDTSNVIDMSEMFESCYVLNSITFGDNFDTSNVIDMNGMFASCEKLVDLDLNHFDTRKVEDMSSMFMYAFTDCNITEFDISNFRYDNCENVESMFYEAFKENVNLKMATEYHASKILTTNGMFRNAKIKSVNLEGLDTSKVIYMNSMFEGSKVKTLDIKTFSFDSLEEAEYMFKDCIELTTIYASASNPIKARKEAYSSLAYDNMFEGCNALVGENGTKIDGNPVDGSYAVIDGMPSSDIKGYFTMVYDKPTEDYKLATGWYAPTLAGVAGKEALTKVIVKKGIPDKNDYKDVSGVGKYSEKFVIPNSNGLVCVVNEVSDTEKNAFIYAPYLDTTPYSTTYDINAECKELFKDFTDMTAVQCNNASNGVEDGLPYLDASACADFSHMFDGCNAITNINLTGLKRINATDDIDIGYMFKNCSAAITITFDDDFKGKVNAASMRELFKNLSNLTTLNIKWGSGHIDTSNATDMDSMYDGCEKLANINLSDLNTSNIASMSYMFNNCKVVTNLDVSSFDTSNVETMAHMFDHCEKVAGINLGANFHTPKVKTMEYMFNECQKLNNLSVNFKTDVLTNTTHMFNNDLALNILTLGSNFKCQDVKDMSYMFYKCPLSGGLNLSSFNTENVETMECMFWYAFGSYMNGTIDLSKFTFTKCTNVQLLLANTLNANSDVDIVLNPAIHSSMITNMQDMFNATHAKSIDLGGLDTSKATTMQGMFTNLSKVTVLDIRNMRFDSVTNLKYMFERSKKLTTIIASTNNAICYSSAESIFMFNQCDMLIGQNGFKYRNICVDKSYARIDGWPYSGATGYFTMIYDEPTADYHLATNWYTPDDPSVLAPGELAPPTNEITKVIIKTGEPNYNDYKGSSGTGEYYDKFYIPGSDHLVCVIDKNKVAHIYAPYMNKSGYREVKILAECKELFKDFTAMTAVQCNNASNGVENGLSYLDAEVCTDFSYMFDGCNNITNINLTGLIPNNAQNIEYMFKDCNEVTNITFDNAFKGTLSATSTMKELFKGLSQLTTLTMKFGTSNINTVNIKDMGSMFEGCTKLSKVNSSDNGTFDFTDMNTSNVATMSYMFKSCQAAKVMNVSGFDTQNVKTMAHMFDECWIVSSINLPANLDTSKVTTMEYMYYDCQYLNNLNINYDTTALINTSNMFNKSYRLDNLTLGSNFKCQNVTDMTYMFANCSLSAGLNLSNFVTSNVEDMSYMFYNGLTKYTGTTFNISNFRFDNCIKTKYMFEGAFSANNKVDFKLPTEYHVSNINDMEHMFTNAKIKSINLEGFDTSHVTNMVAMFEGTYITEIDIRPMSFDSATNVGYMFKNCTSLKTIYASTSNIIKTKATAGLVTENMFENCNVLMGENGTKYSVANVKDGTYACIDGMPSSDIAGYFTMIYDVPTEDYMFEDGWYAPTLANVATNGEIKKVIIKKGIPKKDDYADNTGVGRYSEKFMIPESHGLVCVVGNAGTTDKNVFIYAPYLDTAPYSTTYDINVEAKDLFRDFASMTAVQCNNASNVAQTGLPYLNAEACTDFSHMFDGCNNITNINLTGLKPINAQNIEYMFKDCNEVTNITFDSAFKGELSADSTMKELFYNLTKLTTITMPFGDTKINTENIEDMSSMFDGCIALTNVNGANNINLTGMNTTNVMDMNHMFYNCKAVGNMTVSGFNTTNVEDMSYMFAGCENVGTFTVNNFVAGTNLTNMEHMFDGCKKATSINLNKDLNTINVASMSYMFNNCEKLNNLNINYNTNNLLTTTYMFNNCKALNTLTLGSTFTCGNVKDMSYMFYYCPLSGGLNLSSFNTENVETMARMFDHAFGAYKNGTVDLTSFKFTHCISAEYMFNLSFNAGSGVHIKFSPEFHESALTTTRSMFEASRVGSIDLGGLDTSQVSDMNSMFCRIRDVVTLDISRLDFGSVTNTGYMFYQCDNLKTIIASTNNTIYNRKQASIPDWHDENMFYESKKLVGQNGFSYKASCINGQYARIDGWPYSGATGYFTMIYEEPTNDYHLATGWYQPDTTPTIPTVAPTKDQITKVIIKTGEPNYNDYKGSNGYGEYYDKFYIPGSDHLVCVIDKNKVAHIYAPYMLKVGYREVKILAECKELFKDFTAMTAVQCNNASNGVENGLPYLDASACIDFSHMFDGCNNITNINLTGLKSTGAENIEYMFKDCNEVTTITFDNAFKGTLSATSTMKELFYNLSKLTTVTMPFGTSNINTVNIEDMSHMFDGCIALTNVNGTNNINLSGMKTDNVMDMNHMFYNCKAVGNMTVNGFDTAKVKDMSYMFAGCENVGSFIVNNFVAGTDLTNMEHMFDGCKKVTSINLNKDLNTTNVASMSYMFNNCEKLNNLNINYNTNSLLTTAYMFNNCKALNTLTLGNTFTCGNVKDMSYMFAYCPLSMGLNLSNFDTANVETMTHMFDSAFTKYLNGTIDLSNFKFTKCTDVSYMFYESLNSSSTVGVKLNSDYHESSITNMKYMFDFSNANDIDFGGFDTSKVIDMDSAFDLMKNIEVIDISSLDFSSVENVKFLFYKDSNLKTIIASTNNTLFNSTIITDSTNMFYGCLELIGQNGSTLQNLGIDNKNAARIDGWKDSTCTGYFTMVYDKPDGDYTLATDWYQPDPVGAPGVGISEAAPNKNEIKKVVFKAGEPNYNDYKGVSGIGEYYDKFYIPGSNNLICVVAKLPGTDNDKVAYIYTPYKGKAGYEGIKTIAEC